MNTASIRLVALSACMALCASSCQEFFTNSLASGLARSSYTIPAGISVTDAMDLLTESGSDPQVAQALVPVLTDAVEGATPGTQAYDEAASALVTAVVTSSEVSQAEVDALALVMANPPADGMSAETAYMSAMALMSEAFAQVGVADAGAITLAEGTALKANAAYQLALQYLALGNTISGGSPTGLGGTLQGMVDMVEAAVNGA